ncbi:MAG: uracil-DNA glycosylase [Endomicrobium sp.]|jgi:DNA polymerase|nr:uracil-DNA glycosylase [Endomicrobium sp.]
MKQSEYSQIIKLAKRSLEEYQNWDEDEIYKDPVIKPATDKSLEKNIGESSFFVKKAGPAQELAALKAETDKCGKCPLGSSRLNCVFGVGAADADLMFVGEGPGFDEDHKGEPFIGRAGQLLTKIIEAMGYTRETVYIANIVKCHPMKDPSDPELRSNDRPPTQEEMDDCRPYLDKQLEIIRPKIIVTLGASSTRGLLGSEESISTIRGSVREYNGIKLMPTYHPAALLRNPSLKKVVWDDMKIVTKFLKTGKI